MALSILSLAGFFVWAAVHGIHNEAVTINGARLPVLALLAVAAMGTSGFAVAYRFATHRNPSPPETNDTTTNADQPVEREPSTR